MKLFKPLTFTNVLILLVLLVVTSGAKARKSCPQGLRKRLRNILETRVMGILNGEVNVGRCEHDCGVETIAFVNNNGFCIDRKIAMMVRNVFTKCKNVCRGNRKFREGTCNYQRIHLHWYGGFPSFCEYYQPLHGKPPSRSPTPIGEDNSTTSTVPPRSESEDAI